jgi:hypothetical protein
MIRLPYREDSLPQLDLSLLTSLAGGYSLICRFNAARVLKLKLKL